MECARPIHGLGIAPDRVHGFRVVRAHGAQEQALSLDVEFGAVVPMCSLPLLSGDIT